MEFLGGLLLAALLLFIGKKAGVVTILFHKPADKPHTGKSSGGTSKKTVKK